MYRSTFFAQVSEEGCGWERERAVRQKELELSSTQAREEGRDSEQVLELERALETEIR